MTNHALALSWAAPLVSVELAIWVALAPAPSAEASGAEALALGREVYAADCASCHGANLEGQPDWKRPLNSGRMPAPPHDASGHTWHHGDGVLFRTTKEGAAAVVGGGYQSDMPAFGDVLSDAEIRAVLAFIRSAWPERERAYQAEMSRRESGATQKPDN